MHIDTTVAPHDVQRLEAGLGVLQESPADHGRLELIVRRPQVDMRETITHAELTLAEGLQGDTWNTRGSSRTADGLAHPDRQLTLVNTRLLQLLEPDRSRWPLAGDQLYVDLDLSITNLPAGTQLQLGEALIVITAEAHTGCKKFAERFGAAALRFVSTPIGRDLRLRGAYARVVRPGAIRIGDRVGKVAG